MHSNGGGMGVSNNFNLAQVHIVQYFNDRSIISAIRTETFYNAVLFAGACKECRRAESASAKKPGYRLIGRKMTTHIQTIEPPHKNVFKSAGWSAVILPA